MNFGEEFGQLFQSDVDDLLPGFIDQRLRRTYYQFYVAPLLFRQRIRSSLQLRFVKHPLDSPIEQDRVLKFSNLAIEPKVDSSDRRTLETLQPFRKGRG